MDSGNGFVKDNANNFAVAYRFMDLLVIVLTLVMSLMFHKLSFDKDYLILVLVGLVGFAFASESFSLYRSWRSGYFKQLAFYTLISWGLAVGLVLVLMFFTKSSTDFSRFSVGVWFFACGFVLVAWRFAFYVVLQELRVRGLNTRDVAIIGLGDRGVLLAEEILDHPETGYRLKAVFDDRRAERLDGKYVEYLKGNVQDAIDGAHNGEFDVIYIALPATAEARVYQLLRQFGDTTADVHVVPDMLMYCLMHARMSHVGEIQTISVFENPMQGGSAALKRFEDIVLSLIILSVIAIPMLFIALGIKLTSKGPVIFKQNRYGLNGKPIEVWKFRSMTVMENSDKVVQATKNDARITPFGGFLRRTSLDELPQFLNVLMGSMSIIGPRPHAVSHNEEYRKIVDYYMLRHKVKPGITGWAQVNGCRGETDTLEKMEQRIEYDLQYIRNWSLWMDFKIFIFTLTRAFTDKNAY